MQETGTVEGEERGKVAMGLGRLWEERPLGALGQFSPACE
jgi:hypothetical protein